MDNGDNGMVCEASDVRSMHEVVGGCLHIATGGAGQMCTHRVATGGYRGQWSRGSDEWSVWLSERGTVGTTEAMSLPLDMALALLVRYIYLALYSTLYLRYYSRPAD